jgi:hypothetical protein
VIKPVFIHISKNAGTSIAVSAKDHVHNAGHQSASRWVSNNGDAASLFAVIRNPYARVYSEYRYRKRRFLSGEQNQHLSNLDKPFDEWVLSTYRDGEFRTSSFFDKTGYAYNSGNMIDDTLIWFVPQTRWLSDDDGESLVTDLLRYENLEHDWASFASKNNFGCNLKHLNASTATIDPRAQFSDETRDLIYEYYHSDFDEYEYDR